MSKWQFWRESPFVQLEAIALTGAILASTDKQKALAMRIREEWNDCWTHGFRAKWRQRSRFFEPPLRVKLKNESLLEDSFLIYREDSESVFAQVNKVLEVNLREAKLWLGHFTISITNLQQTLRFELSLIFSPASNIELFTTALKNDIYPWHLYPYHNSWDYAVIEILAQNLILDYFFLLEVRK